MPLNGSRAEYAHSIMRLRHTLRHIQIRALRCAHGFRLLQALLIYPQISFQTRLYQIKLILFLNQTALKLHKIFRKKVIL